MFSTVVTGAFCGMDSYLVQVEADVARGLPGMEMIGCLSREASEAKDRIRVALKNIGVFLPPSRITVNLSPADRHKSGSGYDLPVAVALLISIGELPKRDMGEMLFLGELGLNGEIKPVKGILPIVRKASQEGIKICFVPKKNEKEAGVIENVTVYGVSHLLQVMEGLKNGLEQMKLFPAKNTFKEETVTEYQEDFKDVKGQESVKRAAEIAAAGFHHLLLIGPPGSGKTMIARRIPSILPPLSLEESLEVSGIYSIAGALKEGKILKKRPFISPHHTASGVSLAGGGRMPVPGAVSMAHRGVLFLDELTEFKRNVLDVLRQPMQERKVQIVRTYGSMEYPADFMLVAAMNPCPCGHYPNENKCSCTEREIRRYLSHVSGPFLDRIDLCVSVEPLKTDDMLGRTVCEDSRTIRNRVIQARELQKERLGKSGLRFNGEMDAEDVRRYCTMEREAKKQMEMLLSVLEISAREYHKIMKTARTIADLDGKEKIGTTHVDEAVYYRTASGKYWGKRS